MTKVSITGPKTQLDTVITTLYELEVLDIDEYEGESLQRGDPFEEAENLSQLLVDVRSLKSKLPEVENGNGKGFSLEKIQDSVQEINERVDELTAEKESLKNRIQDVNNDISFFRKLKGCEVKYSDFEGTERLDTVTGRIDAEGLEEELGDDDYQIFEGRKASVVVFSKDAGLESTIREHVREELSVPDLDVSGLPEEVISQLKKRRSELKSSRREIQKELDEIANEWYPSLAGADDFLTEKVEKAEAPIKFGTTDKAFVAQGWMPSEKYEQVEEVLADVCEGKIHMQKEEGEEPPVKHNNAGPVKPFEALTDLVSIPRYNEVDPSFLLLMTFPLFFGLMIGDAGYGITSGIVFLAGWKLFPAAADIFKALLWTSGATFIFGLIYGEMFGFQIYESPLYRADWWTEIVYLTVAIGVAHVNIGLLVGAYNEYVNHGLMEAIFAKISWILLQPGVVIAYLAGSALAASYGALVGIATFSLIVAPILLMMYKGEGVEAIVEIPSIVSNILSYIRLFGVCMAAYTLAGTVNAIAGPMYASGTLMGIAGGTLILIIGHAILTFIKIMEGFLQGIRLHYVEMFNQFYHGGGRKYLPFGAE